MSSKLKKNLIKLQSKHRNIDWEKFKKVSNKSFLQDYPLNPFLDKDLYEIIFANEVLGRVIDYLGEVPILYKASFWNSPNKEIVNGTSQFFHIDGEGLQQVRVIFPLEELKTENGPFTCIDIKKTEEIQNRLFNNKIIRTRSDRVSDIEIPEKIWNECTGNLGDMFMVDTNKCYHFGSRPKSNKKVSPRVMLSLQFITHTCAEVPTFFRSQTYKSKKLEDLVIGQINSKKLWLWKKGRWKYYNDTDFSK